MNQIYVALDLETTGLRPETDAIIEVGAVRFSADGQVRDSWSSLVNPLVPIPRKIQVLTGITPQDVARAPTLHEVLPALGSFARDYPIVGHNVSFDRNFLSQKGLPLANTPIDTFELASILLPKMPSYNLEMLTKSLNIQSPTYHRALEDARLAKDLFLALLERALDLDLETVQEINRAAARTDWPLRRLFQDIEREKVRYGFASSIREQLRAKGGLDQETLGLAAAGTPWEAPLTPSPTRRPINTAALAVMLEEGGLLSRAFPGYEHRPEQIAMLRAVAEAFNADEHLIVEAGTGVGKTVAYLLPAIFFAVANGRHVVISTNTINLQDQIYNKDIPDLQKMFQVPSSTVQVPGSNVKPETWNMERFRAALVKGRANYLCLRHWGTFRHNPNPSVDEIRLLAKILIWLPTTLTGDRAELTITAPAEQAAWGRLAANAETCTPDTCNFRQRDACFLYRARKAAEAAHLIVVNHALLFSDIVTENRVLPEHSHLIVDEAHHLEDVATTQLGYDVDQRGILAFLDSLNQPVGGERTLGLLSELPVHFRGSTVPVGKQKEIEAQMAVVVNDVERARQGVYRFFNVLTMFLTGHVTDEAPSRQSSSGYDQPVRLTGGLRAQPNWGEVEIAWDDCSLLLGRVQDGLGRLHAAFSDLNGQSVLDLEELLSDLATNASFLGRLRARVRALISEPSHQEIYWLTVGAQDQEITLHTAPLHVGELLESLLWSQKDCLVLTSATLATEGTFDYVQERLGLEDAKELLVGSPFDYQSSTLIYIPNDIPEPGRPGYQKAVEQALLALGKATQGRALVLFTSHNAVRSTYQSIVSPLEEEGITVLGHGIDGTPRQLIERFKVNPKAMVLGTSSLWEGVDVVGEALSVLVIGKLPFAVPTDPIFAARSEAFEDAFAQYAVPQTVLKFKQGFGRLIRSKTDRGVVVILDRRLSTKAYGRAFLDSLPRCSVLHGPLSQLPREAAAWLDMPLPVQRRLLS